MGKIVGKIKEMIDIHFKNRLEASPLIILGNDDQMKSEILQYICDKYDFQVTSSSYLAESLLESVKTAGKNHNTIDRITETALVINDVDFFKKRTNLQRELVWFMLKVRCPIVLAVTSYEDFSWEMRRFIGEGKIINI